MKTTVHKSLTILAFTLAAALLFPVLSRAGNDKAGPKTFEGKPAPDFALQTLAGQPFKLADQKGKVVLVDLWATWCGPCVKSLPHIQELSANKELTDKGLVVVASNVGEDKDTVQKFIDAKKFTLTVLLDAESTLPKSLGVTGIPTTLIIGRDGVVKKVFVGNAPAIGDQPSTQDQIHRAIEEALEQPAQ